MDNYQQGYQYSSPGDNVVYDKDGIPVMVNSQKSAIIAVILALLAGGLGLHQFYLGFIGKGVTQLILTVLGSLLTIILIGYVFLGIVAVWVFFDIVLMLVNSDYRDAKGVPLKRW